MRTQAAWKVDTHIFSATGPTRAPTRWRISAEALFVNVIARISNGERPSSTISQAMRWVSTRVLPEPAPATTRSGPPRWVTASRWAGLRPETSSSASGRTIGPTLPAHPDPVGHCKPDRQARPASPTGKPDRQARPARPTGRLAGSTGEPGAAPSGNPERGVDREEAAVGQVHDGLA